MKHCAFLLACLFAVTPITISPPQCGDDCPFVR